MTAEPLNGREAAFLRTMRQMSPREQTAVGDAMQRMLDGQSAEDSGVEMFVELGKSPAQARREVRAAIRNESDWRKVLD
jgi:hypothetical protein